MSWYRKVKTIYIISLTTISFIVWQTLCNYVTESLVDYKLFLTVLAACFFMQYLNSKKQKKYVVIAVPFLLGAIPSLIFNKGQSIILNLIFILFMIITTFSIEDKSIDYSQYKEDIKKSMVALLFIWVISFAMDKNFVNQMYKFHVFYLIMVIILMRESRRYIYDIKANKSYVTNIIIGLGIVSLSLDYANEIVSKTLKVIINLFSYGLGVIIYIIVNTVGRLLGALTEKLKAYMLRHSNGGWKEGVFKNTFKKPNEMASPNYQGIEIPPFIILVFKILIFILILYGIYKFVSRFTTGTKSYKDFVEEKEKITKNKRKKRRFTDMLSSIFANNGTNREKILYTYKNFERVTGDAKIYKEYMTATQLKNVTKINVDNIENLDEMTDSYNEAKFSTHGATDEQVQVVKKAYNNVKKQL